MSLDRTHEEVEPIPKPTRPWLCKKNLEECERTKPCVTCRNARSARKGKRGQRLARKVLKIPPNKFVGQQGNEESWVDVHCRDECKAGAQAGPVGTRFLAMEAQSFSSERIGDPRVFRAIWVPPGWATDVIVGFRGSVYTSYIKPALDAYYGDGESDG